jgi:hypothetical protein
MAWANFIPLSRQNDGFSSNWMAIKISKMGRCVGALGSVAFSPSRLIQIMLMQVKSKRKSRYHQELGVDHEVFDPDVARRDLFR